MTDEQKAKLNTDGLQLGRAWNRGIPSSEEARRKNSEANKGRVAWNKSKKMSMEARRKMSARKIGKPSWNKGKKQPETSGPNHYNWKGGLSSPIMKLRTSYDYKAWRLQVLHRDWFSCRFPGCKHIGRGIEAHHIVSVKENPDLVFDTDNGITLCIEHHDYVRGDESLYAERFVDILKTTAPLGKILHG